MRRLVQLAARLYPAAWRRRYAREFEALLEDVEPGSRELFDVVNGAFTMQMRTRGTIPVVCAIVGALAGGIVAMRTPDVFASSATIRVKAGDVAGAESTAEELQATLEKALASANGTKHATTVSILRGGAATTLKLTYLDRDPAQAQRVAEELTAAIATGTGDLSASAEVLDAPDLPASPIRPDYPVTVASGGGVGLVAGGVVLLLLRSRRRPARAV